MHGCVPSINSLNNNKVNLIKPISKAIMQLSENKLCRNIPSLKSKLMKKCSLANEFKKRQCEQRSLELNDSNNFVKLNDFFIS